MNQKLLFILIGAVAIILLVINLLLPNEKNIKRTAKQSPHQPLKLSSENSANFLDSLYKDAPHPFDLDPKSVYEAKKLWPHLAKPQPTAQDRERNRQQWREFADKYPNNLYIPSYARPPITQEDAEKIRKQIELVADMETNYALMQVRARNAQPGSAPPTQPTKAQVTPAKQRAYFQYKIREVESKIQLIEYTIAQNKLKESQKTTAQKDLQIWKKQLKELQEISAKVPRT